MQKTFTTAKIEQLGSYAAKQLRSITLREPERNNSHNGLIYLLTYSLTNFKRCAFTMAEILLSLTIIGVVAAITLPSLTGNINERTWNTQRKALYARMSQAVALMPALNGFGEVKAEGQVQALLIMRQKPLLQVA